MSLGEKLQKLRKARNLSQEELAAELSVTRQTVSKWELDQSTPELSLLAQLSDIFGVTTDYLIKGTADGGGERINEERPVKKPSARLALYIILLCLGAPGTAIICILSGLHPWEVYADGGIYTGLQGYLMGSHMTFIFALCVLSAIVGFGGLIYLSVQEKKKQA